MSDTEVGGIKGFLTLDDSDWNAKIDRAIAKARELGEMHPDIRVTADTTSAVERLTALDAMLREIGSQSATVDVKVRESGSTGGISSEVDAAAASTEAMSASQDRAAASAAAEAAAETSAAAAITVKATAQARGVSVAQSAVDAAIELVAAEDAATAAIQQAEFAEIALQAAQAAQAEASETVAAAEASLAIARESRFTTTAELTAAEEALAAADVAVIAAADAATAADADLSAAQMSAADSAALVAAAEEGLAAAQAQAAVATQESAESLDLMQVGQQAAMVGIAGLITAIGPLTGAATAYAGAATAMGAAGVAAILGIRNEMAEGTAVGQTYSAGLQQLKGDFDELADNAAVEMLGSFQQAERTVSADMPALNGYVGTFVGYLGQSGNNLIDGVVSGLDAAMPLFEQGAGYIEQWTADFAAWTKSSSFTSFIDYAEAELPVVTSSLEATGRGALDLIENIAPLGQLFLQTVGGAGELVDVLERLNGGFGAYGQMTDEYATKATKATTVGDAFKDSAASNTSVLGTLANVLRVVQDNLDGTTGADQRATQAKQAQAAVLAATANTYGMTSNAYETAKKAADDQTASTLAATQAMQMEDDAAGLLSNALTILNGGSLSLAQAQTGVASANNAAVQSFKTNKAVIDGSSAAAVANQQAVEQQVSAAQQLAQAQAKATGSTEAGVKSYQDSKAALEGALKAQGDLTPAVQAYIDKLYDVSNLKVQPTKLEIDKSSADAAMSAYLTTVENLPKTHTTNLMAEKQAAEAAIATLRGDLSSVPASQRTTLEAEIASAEANLATINARIASIPRSVTTVVSVVGTGAAPVATGHVGFAHGGTIAQHFADGGTSGTVYGSVGSATSDSLTTSLSIGEEVVNAYAASYPGARAVIKSINANPQATMDAIHGGGGTMKHIVELRDRTDSGLGQFVEATVTSVVVKRDKQARTQRIGGSVL